MHKPVRILLIALNRQRFVHPVPPIGVLYLAEVLRKRGHDIGVLHLMFQADPQAAVIGEVRSFCPDVVGISIRNIDALISKTEFTLPDLRLCVRRIQELSSATIVLGGAGFSLFPEAILDELGLDLGIVGESDDTFPELVECLAEGKSSHEIGGLCHRTAHGLVANPPSMWLTSTRSLSRRPT